MVGLAAESCQGGADRRREVLATQSRHDGNHSRRRADRDRPLRQRAPGSATLHFALFPGGLRRLQKYAVAVAPGRARPLRLPSSVPRRNYCVAPLPVAPFDRSRP